MTTAARPPQYDISLDTLDRQRSLRDYQRADAALVRTIEAQQHALACGWGTPPQVFSFRLAIGQSTAATLTWTTDFLLRVPPFCTNFRVSALVSGYAFFALQVGSLQATRFELARTVSEPNPTWLEGSSLESQGNDSGFMAALAAQSADWQTVVVRLTALESYTGLHSLAFYPLLEQAV